MYKTTVTYTDYDDVQRTEDLYFNLTTAELIKMENSIAGGLQKRIEIMMQRHDVPTIMQTMEDLIKQAYGQKSMDGRKFVKSDEIYDDFLQSGAYNEFYMGVITDEKKSSEFLDGIIPSDIKEKVKELEQNGGSVEVDGKVIEMPKPNA